MHQETDAAGKRIVSSMQDASPGLGSALPGAGHRRRCQAGNWGMRHAWGIDTADRLQPARLTEAAQVQLLAFQALAPSAAPQPALVGERQAHNVLPRCRLRDPEAPAQTRAAVAFFRSKKSIYMEMRTSGPPIWS